MKVDIYDTYARALDGSVVHFDVVVPQGTGQQRAFEFARQWLDQIGQTDVVLEQSRCNYCHSEIASEQMIDEIARSGLYIIEMEGCPAKVR